MCQDDLEAAWTAEQELCRRKAGEKEAQRFMRIYPLINSMYDRINLQSSPFDMRRYASIQWFLTPHSHLIRGIPVGALTVSFQLSGLHSFRVYPIIPR
jgi:hypothetical protein